MFSFGKGVSGEPRTSKPANLGRCGGYELLVELAAGGMATVYLGRAVDGRDAPLVAVKRPHKHLASDKVYLSMLVDEARLASAIEHDNVVKVRELGFDSGEPFIIMDYVEGASLADVRKELSALGRALDPRYAVRITLDALAGLQAAHVLHDDSGKHLGIVHRDVSPHNVLLGCDGLVRLTDFGVAKATDRVQVTRTHEVKGKLAYLAPERIDKRRICTVQSDVFSMAVVLWECIAGRRLFRGDEAIDTLQEVMTAPIPALRKLGVAIPQALDDVVMRGLSRDLDTRYKTAAEFAAALERAAGSKQHVATQAEIAALVEALFGDRLRVRHEEVRSALGAHVEAEHVLEVSGLAPRPAPTPEMRERERVAALNLAPPAPSARYAFGQGSENVLARGLWSPRVRKIALGASIVIAGASVTFFALRKPHDAAAGASGSGTPHGEPAFRRVVVPLPFPALKITFDEQARELITPTDTVVFDVPRESGTRHRVTATGEGGQRAEAFVREVDGIARAEGDGFAVEALDAYDDETVLELPTSPGGTPTRVRRPRAGGARRDAGSAGAASSAPLVPAAVAPKPIGTVKDGFTKLR